MDAIRAGFIAASLALSASACSTPMPSTPDATDADDLVTVSDALDLVAQDVVRDAPAAVDTHIVDARDVAPADASCHLPVPADDSLATARDTCNFHSGAHIADTVDDPATIAAARTAIQHLFIIMQENHSVDTYFGYTGHGIEGVPAGYTNTSSTGTVLAPHHFANTCPCDIPHSPSAVMAEWNDGGMNGFLTTDGPGALGYFEDADHPFYTWLITTFATSDRYFCALLGNTGPNRMYFYQGSLVSGAPTIFDEMNSAGVDWGDYVNGYALSADGGTLVGGNNLEDTYGHNYMLDHTHSLTDLYNGLTSGSLPPVAYIDVGSDEHPADNIHDGERNVRAVVMHIFASAMWSHSAIIFTYDEAGGFFDHVPPPSACVATSSSADAPFTHLGIRVPLFVVSPYARAGYVSHRVHSHTSVLRFIEMLHDLPALTNRDANSDVLLDLFDFGCPTFATPPTGAPDAGTPNGACSTCSN